MQAVFFDLDGTLLDTLRGIHVCVNAVRKRHGAPEAGLDETRAAIGDGALMLMRRMLPSEDAAACAEEFRALYEERCCALSSPYEGVQTCLAALKGAGKKLAVITNKPHGAAVKLLGACFGEGTFDLIAGDSGAFPVKPDPAAALHCAKTLGVQPSEVLFAGDGEADLLTAERAGMHHVAVLWGYRSKKQLEEAGARVFAERAEEIVSLAALPPEKFKNNFASNR